MLFSQPELAATMGELFECAWEELRPAPHVTIDFQNGHVLERTLNGNVATLLCTPGGSVYDVLPGIMNPEVYAAQLQESAERFRELPAGGVGRLQVQLDCVRRARELREVAALMAASGAYIQDFNVEIGKGAVEVPVKVALGEPVKEPAWFTGQGTAGKGVVELPIKTALDPEPPGLNDFDRANLALDTASLFDHVLPDALDLLAARPLCRTEELTPLLFREVLHVDLEDPFLGLAPDVLGGRLGRYGPKGADGPVPGN